MVHRVTCELPRAPEQRLAYYQPPDASVVYVPLATIDVQPNPLWRHIPYHQQRQDNPNKVSPCHRYW